MRPLLPREAEPLAPVAQQVLVGWNRSPPLLILTQCSFSAGCGAARCRCREFLGVPALAVPGEDSIASGLIPSRLRTCPWDGTIPHIFASFVVCISHNQVGWGVSPGRLHYVNVEHVPASPRTPNELLEKPEASSPRPAHAHQLGSSPGAPRRSQSGQAWPRHLPDPSAPRGLPTVSVTSGL